jgi:DNA-binding NarL/FixJ family response regulator
VTARAIADLKWGTAPQEVPLRDLLERIVGMLERLTPEELGRVLAAANRTLGATVAGRTLLASLSSREREVFDLAVRGATTANIATALHISVKTAQTHRAAINGKLDVHTPAQLIAFAVREGVQ